jgi:subtilisin family serine protease
VVEKLRLPETHQLAKGANVLVAVIDSKIDPAHPDLEGVVAGSFTAVEGEEAAHAHGTGMAGAIASRRKLLGTAPAARILAAHAFSTRAQSGSTTMHILKSLDWAVNQGARVINMSFAGPRDPSLEKALKAARDRGIVLIAAAGNAGPKSPPLFPGADPNVIAVTATDVDDKIFVNANRGGHIAVAAPGVDIIVPAPEGSYQTTTGTSVATAHVSGIAALLLERNPSLTPDQVRKILTSSAKPLGAGPRDKTYGAGLVDAYKAITSLGVPASAQPAQR